MMGSLHVNFAYRFVEVIVDEMTRPATTRLKEIPRESWKDSGTECPTSNVVVPVTISQTPARQH
jgi:hypothetical protein